MHSGQLPLHDVEVAIAEDLKTVSMIAPDGSGDFVTASFELSEKVADEATFNAAPHVEAFENRKD